MTELILKVKNHKVLFVNILFTFISLMYNLALGLKFLWCLSFVLIPLILNEEDAFSCLLFFSLFSRIVTIKLFAIQVCLFTFILVCKTIYLRLKQGKDLKVSLYYGLIIILMFLHNLIVNKAVNIQFVYYLNFINLITIFALIKTKFNKEIILLYGYGLIIVSVISILGYFLGLTKVPFAYEQEVNLLRFTALLPHCNNLGICCVIEVVILFNLMYKGMLPKHRTYLMMILLTIIGISTFSKTFFITITIALIYILICLFVQSKHKKRFIVAFLSVCLLLSPIVIVYLSKILTRFTVFYKNGNILDTLTTGRFGFWKLYLKPFTKNILTIIFGVGVCYNFNTEFSSHSMYVSLLSRLGVVGALLIVMFIVKAVKYKKTKKFNFINYFPLMLMLIIFVVEDISFNTHNTIPFIVSMFLLNYGYNKEKNQLK